MSKKTGWSKIIEAHGIQVRIFERDGVIYRDVATGRTVSETGKARTRHDVRSMKHGDRSLAEKQAKALCKALAEARLTVSDVGTSLTLAQLFSAYRQHRLPALTAERRKEASARLTMFTEAWGGQLRVHDLSQTHVDLYCRKRRELEIVSPGLRTDDEGKRKRGWRAPKPVRDGGLDAEFRWFASVLNWAGSKYKVGGRFLLSSNPLRGVSWPKEKNPRRPIASHARFVATLAHVDRVDPAGRLRCILAIARYTGRRESAICQLSASDLLLTPESVVSALAAAGMDERLAEYMPHGAIRWRAESDKQGFLFVSPMNGAAREAIDAYLRKNPRVGDVPLFPAPLKRMKRKGLEAPEVPETDRCIRRETALRWLVNAESFAGLPKLRGGIFHPYRRLWATERKHLPDVDVAAAGGWKDTQALRISYQQADPASVLRVVNLD